MLPASVELPKSFDARKKPVAEPAVWRFFTIRCVELRWPACFAHVYDMGNCRGAQKTT